VNPTTCQSCGGALGQYGTTAWTCPRCFVVACNVVAVPGSQEQKLRWQVSQDGGKTWTDCKVGK
jgi:hypothetical protein